MDGQRGPAVGRVARGSCWRSCPSVHETVARYDSSAGVLVLAVGAAVCARRYRMMIRIARLPPEERVLR